jgi:hypothetical protein
MSFAYLSLTLTWRSRWVYVHSSAQPTMRHLAHGCSPEHLILCAWHRWQLNGHLKRELDAILWPREMVTHAMNFLRLEDSSVSALWVFFRRFICHDTSITLIEINKSSWQAGKQCTALSSKSLADSELAWAARADCVQSAKDSAALAEPNLSLYLIRTQSTTHATLKTTFKYFQVWYKIMRMTDIAALSSENNLCSGFYRMIRPLRLSWREITQENEV